MQRSDRIDCRRDSSASADLSLRIFTAVVGRMMKEDKKARSLRHWGRED